jgi:hypothetical protein
VINEFVRQRRSGAIVGSLVAIEADILRSLASQVIELLEDNQKVMDPLQDPLEAALDLSGPTSSPDDPVLARLLPDAYVDESAAADFRRFTERGLRDAKRACAQAIIDELVAGGLPPVIDRNDEQLVVDVEFNGPIADLWLRGLNDIRLALGTRLGIANSEEDQRWAQLDPHSPEAGAYQVYRWTSYLQDALLEAVSGD